MIRNASVYGHALPHHIDLQVRIAITSSFSSVLVGMGAAGNRSRVNEIFLVALFEMSAILL